MTKPDELVARVRMALAEAGYPHARVRFDEVVWIGSEVPDRVTWRARNLAGTRNREGLPSACFTCYEFMTNRRMGLLTAEQRGWECLARGERIEDCGVERKARHASY